MEQEHILNTHIDTLKEWWDSAEQGIPSAGDTVIFDERHRGLGFHVTQATKGHPRGYDNARILARAPKPKPAWHEAVAVIAHRDGAYGLTPREVYVRRDGDRWESLSYYARPSALLDVTPLIEAKVTDEMVIRARGSLKRATGYDYTYAIVRDALTAALGLETA